MAKQKQRGMVKTQKLLRAIKNRKLLPKMTWHINEKELFAINPWISPSIEESIVGIKIFN